MKFRSLVHTYVNRRRYLKVHAYPGWGTLTPVQAPIYHTLFLSLLAAATIKLSPGMSLGAWEGEAVWRDVASTRGIVSCRHDLSLFSVIWYLARCQSCPLSHKPTTSDQCHSQSSEGMQCLQSKFPRVLPRLHLSSPPVSGYTVASLALSLPQPYQCHWEPPGHRPSPTARACPGYLAMVSATCALTICSPAAEGRAEAPGTGGMAA